MFKTSILLFCFLLFQSAELKAQLNPYKLRIGAGIGYSNYYGDLSHYRFGEFPDWNSLGKAYSYNVNYNQSPSISLSIEKRINASWGLLLSGGQYTLSMSDRFVDNNHVLKIDAPNFNRALNFKTRIRDIGLGFVFRTDNGKILRENALIAPYLFTHGGWLQFKPKGDLLDVNGNPYDYSQSQLLTDGDFETDLDKLQASSNYGYDENTFYLAGGIGLRIKLTKQIEMFFQSDVKRTNTDFIDDVDGSIKTNFLTEFQEYAAYPGIALSPVDRTIRGDAEINKDWIFNHQFGLKISFYPSKTAFRANTISPSSTTIGTINTIKNDYIAKDSSKNTPTSGLKKSDYGYNKEIAFTPEGKALPIESTAQIEIDTDSDSTLTFSMLNSRINETMLRTDTVIVWQSPSPFRKADPDWIYTQGEETIYRRYNENHLREQEYPQINLQHVVQPSKGKVPTSNMPYILPYYNYRRSTIGYQPTSPTRITDNDTTVIADSTAFVKLDSVEINGISTGFKANPKQTITEKKYKFDPPATFRGNNIQWLNANESKAALIKNGLYTEIYFESNQSTFTDKEASKLIPLVKSLEQNPEAKILIKGFADNTGSATYNLALIEKRVAGVKKMLTNQLGVANEKIDSQQGALLVRGNQRIAKPEDRKVEVRVQY